MPKPLDELKAEAQQVLNDLWDERLIPFVLNVGKITENDDGYTLHFHDSRIHTADISLIEGQSFKDSVKTAVMDRARKISGPLRK